MYLIAAVAFSIGLIMFMIGSIGQDMKHTDQIKTLEERIRRIENENKSKALRTGYPPRS